MVPSWHLSLPQSCVWLILHPEDRTRIAPPWLHIPHPIVGAGASAWLVMHLEDRTRIAAPWLHIPHSIVGAGASAWLVLPTGGRIRPPPPPSKLYQGVPGGTPGGGEAGHPESVRCSAPSPWYAPLVVPPQCPIGSFSTVGMIIGSNEWFVNNLGGGTIGGRYINGIAQWREIEK